MSTVEPSYPLRYKEGKEKAGAVDQRAPSSRIVDAPPPPGEGVTFFGNKICPFAHRTWWSLEEKGIDYDFIHIQLGENKPAWYAQIYPTVPCAFVEGKKIVESDILSEFLELKFKGQGTRLIPDDPFDVAAFRTVVALTKEKVIPHLYGLLGLSNPSNKKETVARLNVGLGAVEEAFVNQSNGPYFFGVLFYQTIWLNIVVGENFSMVEILLVPFLDRFSAVLGFYHDHNLLSGFPRLAAAYEV
eukprot:TRINITY_DN774_c0_g1_i7.p1 TRINITY_DN774_c0_g1~~TRINITY_DN774_c0_g1_i7.p1  ORF type:complete len:244 (-),score=35.00 TRINITY_DN774_c0_g1_i7:7-738(-)